MCVSNLIQIIEDYSIVMICEKGIAKYVGTNIPPEYHGDTVKSMYSKIHQLNASSIVSVIAIEVR